MRSGERRPGPASRTLYYVAPCDIDLDEDLGYPMKFLAELAQVHSDLYFLTPNALTLSAIENRPVLDFFDRAKYDRACRLYHGSSGPLSDLDVCSPNRTQSWVQIYRQNGLIP